jgi:hypothetical protein
VPFENMIYIADGPSDVPAWSVVRGNGGLAFGVYQRGSHAQFEQISSLLRDGRIHAFAEADYRPDSTAHLWLTTEVRRIAERIVEERALALRRAVRAAPTHVTDEPSATRTDAPMQPPRQQPEPMPARSRADEIRESVRRSLDDESASADAVSPPPVRADRS